MKHALLAANTKTRPDNGARNIASKYVYVSATLRVCAHTHTSKSAPRNRNTNNNEEPEAIVRIPGQCLHNPARFGLDGPSSIGSSSGYSDCLANRAPTTAPTAALRVCSLPRFLASQMVWKEARAICLSRRFFAASRLVFSFLLFLFFLFLIFCKVQACFKLSSRVLVQDVPEYIRRLV